MPFRGSSSFIRARNSSRTAHARRKLKASVSEVKDSCRFTRWIAPATLAVRVYIRSGRAAHERVPIVAKESNFSVMSAVLLDVLEATVSIVGQFSCATQRHVLFIAFLRLRIDSHDCVPKCPGMRISPASPKRRPQLSTTA